MTKYRIKFVGTHEEETVMADSVEETDTHYVFKEAGTGEVAATYEKRALIGYRKDAG